MLRLGNWDGDGDGDESCSWMEKRCAYDDGVLSDHRVGCVERGV